MTMETTNPDVRQATEPVGPDGKDRYHLLYDAITEAIFVHTIEPDGTLGRFIEVNEIACQRLGYTREELLRRTPRDIDAPESTTHLQGIIERIRAGEDVISEQIHVAKDGRRIPVEIHARAFQLDHLSFPPSIGQVSG